MKTGKKEIEYRMRCILTGLLCLLFTACGQSKGDTDDNSVLNGGEEGMGEVDAYRTEWSEVDYRSSCDGELTDYMLDGPMLYYIMNHYGENEQGTYFGSMNILTDPEPTVELLNEGIATCIFPDPEGGQWIAVRYLTENGETSAWQLERTEETEQASEPVDISAYIREDEAVQDAARDAEGNFYLLHGQPEQYQITVTDADGNLIRAIGDLEGVYELELLADAGVLFDRYGQSAQLLNARTLKTEELKAVINNQGELALAAQPDGTILFVQDGYLMRYREEAGEPERLVNLSQNDIMTDSIKDISVLPDDRIVVLLHERTTGKGLEIALLQKALPDEVAEKKTLRLGITRVNPDLQLAVTEFNKENEEYCIEIVNYFETDWNEATAKLKQDIGTGNGPDIMEIAYLTNEDLEAFLEKGILADLTPYLESSQTVSREDLLPNLLECYTSNGVLYGIPNSFYVCTLAGRQSELGESSGWTREEFMDYAAGVPENAQILTFESKYSVFSVLMGRRAEGFVDWESGTCYLDGEDFRKCLEFANRYPGPEELQNISYEKVLGEVPGKLASGELLLYEVTISDIMDLQKVQYYFGVPVTYIGYPTADGSIGTYVMSDMLLGINGQSEYKDAAWEFLSALLSQTCQEQQVDRGAYGFPVRKDALEYYFEKSMEGNYLYDEDGKLRLDGDGNPMELPKDTIYECGPDGSVLEIQCYAARPEEVEMMRDIIASIRENSLGSHGGMQIINDECNPYFWGQKSMDETIDVLQNRMELYLQERQ